VEVRSSIGQAMNERWSVMGSASHAGIGPAEWLWSGSRAKNGPMAGQPLEEKAGLRSFADPGSRTFAWPALNCSSRAAALAEGDRTVRPSHCTLPVRLRTIGN